MTDIPKKNLTKIDRLLLKAILPDFINGLHLKGVLSDADLKDQSLLVPKVQKYLALNKKLDFRIIVDHRETILKVAEQQNKNNHFEFAIALYGTFVEHTLNRIIHLACKSKKIDDKTSIEIIKNVNIIGKCTWLMKLLGLSSFKQEYVKTILSIAEERNAYFHYKWKPEADDFPAIEKTDKTNKEKLIKVKALIKYLRSYESRYEFRGRKNKIVKAAYKNETK